MSIQPLQTEQRILSDNSLRLERRLFRANEARKQAEKILDKKASELYNLSQLVTHERDLLKVTLGSIYEGVISVDADANVVFANSAALSLLEVDEKQIINYPLKTVLKIQFLKRESIDYPLRKNISNVEKEPNFCVLLGHKGKRSTVEITHSKVSSEAASTHNVIVIRDITDTQEMFGRIKSMSDYDQVTSLPNRNYFTSLLSSRLDNNLGVNGLALYSVYLDNFKNIIDTDGFEKCDDILSVATYISEQILRPCDIIGRVNVDEFMVVVDGISCQDEAMKVGEYIGRMIKNFRSKKFPDIHLTASIGVAMYPKDSADCNLLMRSATLAMQTARKEGNRSCQLLDAAIMTGALRKIEIEKTLPTVLMNNDLELYFQPKWDIRTKKINGAEALLRWVNSSLGNVSPLEVIEVAESTGFIVDIGWWVINEACDTILSLIDKGIEVPIAVNVSAKQLLRDDFIDRFEAIVSKLDGKMHLLSVELTETSLIHSASNTADLFKRMLDMGVKVSIDDFGIGYSNLSYIQSLNFSELKVDKAFVDNMCHNENSLAIVRAIVVMAKGLGLNVVAEGIEYEAQREKLIELGCNQGQGYLVSKPITRNQLTTMLGMKK